MSVEIIEATTPQHLDIFRTLCLEYARGLPFSLCFQGFDDELASLPGLYARPRGLILLAFSDATPAGCVALRPIPALPTDAPPVCEMKRMFVRPAHRGLRLGHLLAERLVHEARAAGYATMKLDSEPDFHAALAVYRRLGFTPCARYNNDPHPQTVYLSLNLRTTTPPNS
ncbi:MAG: GNAT family N-acetyltransferase [Planctomycetota bacterium]|nr:GNAT family N-acetyltransferase [Planctomycetota bacterium]